jgi:hypothetical protein
MVGIKKMKIVIVYKTAAMIFPFGNKDNNVKSINDMQKNNILAS